VPEAPLFLATHTPSAPSEPVRLNVGGRIFCTTLSSLCRVKESMLSAMFSGRFSVHKQADGCFFLDRDGTHFRHVLNYLRDGSMPCQVEVSPKTECFYRELLREACFYQIPGLIEALEAKLVALEDAKAHPPLPFHYLTVRYLPGNTYDGWPIRIEGPLEESVLLRINGGQPFPEKLGEGARHLFGNLVTGWKVRGIFLTKIFNTLAQAHWELVSSNGSGGGKEKNFAEMYVFRRQLTDPPSPGDLTSRDC